MHAIIIGLGKLGFEVARRLVDEGHDVVVVDRDPDRLAQAEGRLDVLTVQGNGASPAVLERAGVERADVVLAVTDSDELNMIACMTAKQMAALARGAASASAELPGPPRPEGLQRPRPLCAGRIRNPDYTGTLPYTRSLRQLGVDVVINPDRLAALEMARLVRAPWTSYVDFFAGGRVVLAATRLAEGAPLARAPLREQGLPCLVVAAVREGRVFLPDGSTRLEPGDRVYLVGRAPQLAEFRALAGAPERTVREVTVIGGGKVGLPLAQLLLPATRRGMYLKLIERDPQRCAWLAEQLPGVLVICGDGERMDVLKEEGVDGSDVVAAVTSQDHTNLLAAMIAKELGVSEVLVTISREDYVPLAERAGADAVVVPRLIAAATALQLVHPRHVLALSILEEGKAEVLELVLGEGAAAARRPLREVASPPDAVVGAVARDGEVLIPTGDTVLQPGDRLIVFTLPQSVARVEALFQGEPPVGGGHY